MFSHHFCIDTTRSHDVFSSLSIAVVQLPGNAMRFPTAQIFGKSPQCQMPYVMWFNLSLQRSSRILVAFVTFKMRFRNRVVFLVCLLAVYSECSVIRLVSCDSNVAPFLYAFRNHCIPIHSSWT